MEHQWIADEVGMYLDTKGVRSPDAVQFYAKRAEEIFMSRHLCELYGIDYASALPIEQRLRLYKLLIGHQKAACCV